MNTKIWSGPGSPLQHYLVSSRSVLYSAIFAVPLFLLYEATALLFRSEINNLRNGADVLLKQLLRPAGVNGFLSFSLVLLLGLLLVIWFSRDKIDGPIRFSYFAGMVGESVLYALGLGFFVSWIMSAILLGPGGFNLATQIVISLGAGIYEELVFRVILVGGFFLALTKILHAGTMLECKPGDHIVQAGQMGREMFVLLSGDVEVRPTAARLRN